MGQPITVTARAGSSATVRIFDCNRSLTGMAIESYSSVDETGAGRPPDVLARRLFDLGATRVTVYSSGVTVEAPADRWPTLEPEVVRTIEHLFGYYGDEAGWAPDACGPSASSRCSPRSPPRSEVAGPNMCSIYMTGGHRTTPASA